MIYIFGLQNQLVRKSLDCGKTSSQYTMATCAGNREVTLWPITRDGLYFFAASGFFRLLNTASMNMSVVQSPLFAPKRVS